MTNYIELCQATTPEEFASLHREDDLPTLVVLKGNLMSERNRYIGKTDPHDEDIWPSSYPSPEELVEMLTSFIETTERLIADRENLEGRTVDDIEYPDGFIEACDLVYKEDGPIYKADEVLGCWMFDTMEMVYNSGPMGVVISTGELVHFHIPFLIAAAEGHPNEHATELERKVGLKSSVILDRLFGEDDGLHDDSPAYPTPARYWQ